jgi:D-alanyl-D-alanine carboxypeptidase/D-alanyl-D-alanine-endopeptidase (penicillin-binding protein 4)
MKQSKRIKYGISAFVGITGLLLASSVPVFTAHASTPTALDSLQSTINSVLADSRLDGAQAGVLVRSAKDNSTLYSRNPDTRLIPGSNAKLYSSTAALAKLGGDYKFNTTVATTGSQVGPIVQGDLYLKGTGDPTMQEADYDKLAAQVAAKGITIVQGHLVADDTFFDSRRLGNNWAWDNNPFSYQPEISALTVAADSDYDIGSLTMITKPTTVGKPAAITTDPATNYVKIQNETTTGAAGSGNTISVERENGVNTIVVSGSIPAGSQPEEDLSTVTDPTGYAASIFRDALQRHGVSVLGATTRGALPANNHPVTVRASLPLSQLYTPFLKLSNNGIAENLVKTMGALANGQGSWDNGLPVELAYDQSQLGVDTSKIAVVDGSGLSNLDFITPQQTTNLLLAAQKQAWFNTWYNALPIAGNSDPLVGGTLASRMVGTKAANNVHAKTGSLTGVSALSGYVTDADGEQLVFSIMENNYIHGSVKPIEDAIAVDLANFSRSSGVSPSVKAQIPSFTSTTTAGKAAATVDDLECSWTKAGC